jgi:hypothetical protein
MEDGGGANGTPAPPWKKEGQLEPLHSMEEGGASGAPALHGSRRGIGCLCPPWKQEGQLEPLPSMEAGGAMGAPALL